MLYFYFFSYHSSSNHPWNEISILCKVSTRDALSDFLYCLIDNSHIIGKWELIIWKQTVFILLSKEQNYFCICMVLILLVEISSSNLLIEISSSNLLIEIFNSNKTILLCLKIHGTTMKHYYKRLYIYFVWKYFFHSLITPRGGQFWGRLVWFLVLTVAYASRISGCPTQQLRRHVNNEILQAVIESITRMVGE